MYVTCVTGVTNPSLLRIWVVACLHSTNLYSTGGSSVDEHIYCEPIDRRSPRTERLNDEEEVPAKRSGSDPVSKPASQSAGETGKTGASCDRNRRGNDQELSELQRNIRGLEQYYYPSPLASPAVPVQLSVMRASVIQQQPLHSSAGIGPEGEPRPQCFSISTFLTVGRPAAMQALRSVVVRSVICSSIAVPAAWSSLRWNNNRQI